jgi:predicted transposase/invertase (TIGR01784 family)
MPRASKPAKASRAAKRIKSSKRAEVVLPAILPLTNDVVFKGSFGVRECVASLIAFLRALCPWLPKEDFEGITFLDTHRKRRHLEDKECVLDIGVRLKSGRMIAIEIQMLPFRGIGNRGQFYNAKMMVETLGKGEQYVDLPQVITIFVLDHRQFKGSGHRHEYRMLDVVSKDELPNSQVLLFIELPKLPAASDGTAEWNWLRLFSVKTREELEALVRKEPAMADVATKVLEMSSDLRTRFRAISREKWRRDQEAILYDAETALDRGRAEGEARGEAKKQAEIARRMLARNMSVDDVAGLTGLPEAAIKRLRRR